MPILLPLTVGLAMLQQPQPPPTPGCDAAGVFRAEQAVRDAQGDKNAVKSAEKNLKNVKREQVRCQMKDSRGRPYSVTVAASAELTRQALVKYMQSNRECGKLSGCKSWFISSDTNSQMTFERPADYAMVSGIGYALNTQPGATNTKLIMQFAIVPSGGAAVTLSVTPLAQAHTLAREYSSEPNPLIWPKYKTLAILDSVKAEAESEKPK